MRKWEESKESPSVKDIMKPFMMLYRELVVETKALVAILNAKMKSIIKTYKVKINCYNEQESVFNRVRYRPALVSYTELQREASGELAPILPSRISRRPATGGLIAPEPGAESSDYDTEAED
jgi:hypothetical protein